MADDQHTNDPFFEDDDFLSAERDSVADEPEAKPNLKEIWDQNPSLKIFAVVAGIAIFLIAFMVFGGDSDKPGEESVVRQTGEVTQAPGTAELPPAYEDAVRAASEQRAEEAAAIGGSSIPTPIARPSERIEAPVQVEENDPLSEWRKEAEALKVQAQEQIAPKPQEQVTLPDLPPEQNAANNNGNTYNQNNGLPPQQQQPENPPLPTGPTPDMVNMLAQQIQQQMQTVLETQVPRESVVVSMNLQPAYNMKQYFPPEDENAAAASGRSTSLSSTGSTLTGASTIQAPPKPIIQAGTIVYAQILTQANSDVPGPVLAELASGPLSGGRALGQFQVAQRHLVLQFSRIIKDGVEYPTQAYALDPGTTLPGVVTDIDNHYFTRVFLPAAARFIEGFAEAATRTNTQAVVSNGTVITNTTNDLDTKQELLMGVNEGAQELSQIIDQQSQRPRTIKVAAGTRVGILFVNSVMPAGSQLQQQQNQQQQQGVGQQYFNNTAVGQAYNAYNNYQNPNQPQTSVPQSGQYNYIATPQLSSGGTIPR